MLAEKIKQYRLSVGLTQKELAEALGTAQNTTFPNMNRGNEGPR